MYTLHNTEALRSTAQIKGLPVIVLYHIHLHQTWASVYPVCSSEGYQISWSILLFFSQNGSGTEKYSLRSTGAQIWDRSNTTVLTEKTRRS